MALIALFGHLFSLFHTNPNIYDDKFSFLKTNYSFLSQWRALCSTHHRAQTRKDFIGWINDDCYSEKYGGFISQYWRSRHIMDIISEFLQTVPLVLCALIWADGEEMKINDVEHSADYINVCWDMTIC